MTPLEAHHLIGWTQQWRQAQVLVDLLKHLKVAMGNTVPRLLMAVSENHPNIAHSLSSFSLWFITPISLWFIGDISILNGIITHLELRGGTTLYGLSSFSQPLLNIGNGACPFPDTKYSKWNLCGFSRLTPVPVL